MLKLLKDSLYLEAWRHRIGNGRHPWLDLNQFYPRSDILTKSFSQEKVEWIEEPVDRWEFILRFKKQTMVVRSLCPFFFMIFMKKSDLQYHNGPLWQLDYFATSNIKSDYFLISNIVTSRQDDQDGHLRRGPLHMQAQREGQEGQVVHQEPGQF